MKCKDCSMYFRDTHNLCIAAEMEKVNSNSDACENFCKAYDEEDYSSATNGDYSPSNPWDAPGMSVKDFIR